MARTGPLHWVGVLFLLVASILLLITTISAPVINDIGLLKVTLTNQSAQRNTSINFGTFGYCVLDVAPPQSDQDSCTSRVIGYDPALEMALVDGTGFSTASADTAKGLTRVMILHPIACGLAFIAFLTSLGAGVVGSLIGAAVAFVAFVITLVVMATDFVWTGIIRNAVNGDGSGSSASFSVGIWTLLAAFILLFFGMFIVLFTCFSARRQKKRERTAYKDEVAAGTTTRRRFWQRSRRY